MRWGRRGVGTAVQLGGSITGQCVALSSAIHLALCFLYGLVIATILIYVRNIFIIKCPFSFCSVSKTKYEQKIKYGAVYIYNCLLING